MSGRVRNTVTHCRASLSVAEKGGIFYILRSIVSGWHSDWERGLICVFNALPAPASGARASLSEEASIQSLALSLGLLFMKVVYTVFIEMSPKVTRHLSSEGQALSIEHIVLI